MAQRRLTLRTERLAELTAGELESVNGASGLPCEPITAPITADLCPTWQCTGCYLTCTC
jgi:hypothetical protein